jgi:bla regulator protein blaR1
VLAVLTVTLSGTQLSTQLTGQPAVEIYPQSATHFFLKVVDANLDFVTTGKGPATAVVLHQNGQNVTLPRMDDAAVAQFDAKVAARTQSKTPQPGTQAAVIDWINRMEKGQPLDYTKMSPPLADAMKAQADQAASVISSLGALQSLTFQRTEASGADVYLAKFLTGSLQFQILIDSKGIINAFGAMPAP